MKKIAILIIFCILFSMTSGFVRVKAETTPTLNVIINYVSSTFYIQLNWNSPSGSKYYYKAERKFGSSNYEDASGYLSAATYESASDILLGTKFGTTCTYRLAIYNESYVLVGYSNTVSFVLNDFSKPTNFQATRSDNGKIVLSWEYNQSAPLTTIIERKSSPVTSDKTTSEDNTWVMIGSTSNSTTTFEDTAISSEKIYTYRIRSILGANCFTSWCESSSVQTVLKRPSIFNVSLLNKTSSGTYNVLIEWANIWSQEVNIVLERKVGNNDFKVIKTLYNNEALYLDTTANYGYSYTYRIKATGKYVSTVDSAYSDEISIIPVDLQAPTGVSALATSNTSIDLSWLDNSNNETGFEVWRSKDEGSSWEKYLVLPANTTKFTDTNLAPAYTYAYKIRAFSSGANVYSYFSPDVRAKTIIPNSNVVLEYTLNNTNNTSTFTWNVQGSLDSTTVLHLEKKGEYDLTWTQLPSFSSEVSSYTDNLLSPYTRYSYRMKIVNSLNSSASYSNTIEFAPGIPKDPDNLNTSALGANTVKLTWDDKSMNEDGFIIERLIPGQGYTQLAKLPAGQKSYIDNMLSPNNTYYYRVAAYNKSGISSYTSEKYFMTKTSVSFTDMNDYNWASEAVMNLVDIGVISGTSQNTFSPNQYISRAEFTRMVVKALKLNKIANSSFNDVKPSDWYFNDIQIAKSYGIISGIDGYFYPENPLTREDMSAILCKGLEAVNNPLPGKDSSILDIFSDRNDISPYAIAFISSLKAEGLINGKDGNRLAPKEYLNRAEAASIIWRILKNKNI